MERSTDSPDCILVDGPFKSPFQLKLGKDKKKDSEVPIPHQNKSTSFATAEDSGKSVINPNPFSLQLKKPSSAIITSPTSSLTSLTGSSRIINTLKYDDSVSSSIEALANLSDGISSKRTSLVTTLSRDDLSPEEKVVELEKEIIELRKEIENKDSKLSSSVKSIKQFWSPELKKERAARKEEAENLTRVTEKYETELEVIFLQCI